ncbi:MAG: hypothetical protein IAF02_29345, partial [Anaerolineae bacterium]|nr:hypothetical protein [Anaerolineae bacterium]
MLNKKLKYGILLIFGLQMLLIIALLTLPSLAQTLPGEMRVRLVRIPMGAALLDLGTTPMPTALPAPAGAVGNARITIPTLVASAAAPTVETRETAVQPKPTTETSSARPATAAGVAQAAPTQAPTAAPPPTQTPTPEPLPAQALIEGVDIIPQGFNNCGPANLAINLNLYGNPTTQTEAAAFLKPNREDRNV